MDEHLDQCRSIVFECFLKHRPHVFSSFCFESEEAGTLRERGKIGILELDTEIEKAASLHYQFDERERIVSENDDLHRQFELMKSQQIAQQHRDATVAGHRNDLSIRNGEL